MDIIKDKRINMDETKIIRDALLSSCEKVDKKNQKIMHEIDPVPLEEHDEITAQLVKQKVKSQKNLTQSKNINNWSNTDFLRYIKHLSGLHGFSLSVSFSSVKDREVISKIHDKLAFHLQQDMNNKILREYIEWWINSYSYLMSGREIYPSIFVFDNYITKFVSRIRLQNIPGNGFSTYKANEQEFVDSANKEEPISDMVLYNHGGLPMLIMSKGIITSYAVMRQKEINSIFTKISAHLQTLSNNALQKVMNLTIDNAPYPYENIVDFVALARASLVYHNMKQYLSLQYKDYFEPKAC